MWVVRRSPISIQICTVPVSVSALVPEPLTVTPPPEVALKLDPAAELKVSESVPKRRIGV